MKTINLTVPKDWNDLTADQLKFVARLFNSPWAQDQYKFLTHAFIRFSGLKVLTKVIRMNKQIRYQVKKKGHKPFYLTSEQLRFSAEKLDWLLKEVHECTPLSRMGIARPVNQRLYATKFIQFLTAENFYIAYQTTQKREHLNALCASLYLLPWQKFSEDKVKSRARYFRLIPFQTKYTAYLWYSGFRYHISVMCGNLFSGKGSGPVNVREHIMGMLRSLTEGDVTKNKLVEQTDTWEALYELDAKAKYINELNKKKR
jgi:hypothetical protein